MALSLAIPFLTARNSRGSLSVGGLNILEGLSSQNILSFSFIDNTTDQADDLSVEIADPHRTWMQTYLPRKGIECQASISVMNWAVLGDMRRIDCGVFWIDQISFGGPPNVISVKGVSIPVGSGIKNQKKYRFWENQSLSTIASQIALENGLLLVWDAKVNPMMKRVDQVDSPDLEFLRDKVKECSLSLKIFKRQLVIYSESEYESRPPVYVLMYGASNILEYFFSSKLDNTFKSAKNAYVSPDTGKLVEAEFSPDDVPEGTGGDLMLNERVDEEPDAIGGGLVSSGGSIDFTSNDPLSTAGKGAGAEAASLRKVKAKLRERNKREKECYIKTVGNPDYISGLNIQLLGFGIFDGKWFIQSSIHSITSSGYTTDLRLRGALTGY